jgi:hypothetical protein
MGTRVTSTPIPNPMIKLLIMNVAVFADPVIIAAPTIEIIHPI